MENKIQVNITNHFISLKWLLFYIILTLLLLVYFYLTFGSEGLFILIIFLLLQMLPTVYLHYKYYVINKSIKCTLNEYKLEVFNKNMKYVYFPNDIEKIIIYKSANMDSWGIPLLTFENYYYSRIVLKDGNNIVLTSLLDNKIEDKLKVNFSTTTFNRKKGFSCFPDW